MVGVSVALAMYALAEPEEKFSLYIFLSIMLFWPILLIEAFIRAR